MLCVHVYVCRLRAVVLMAVFPAMSKYYEASVAAYLGLVGRYDPQGVCVCVVCVCVYQCRQHLCDPLKSAAITTSLYHFMH
jgi:hypothetical protein